MLSALCDDVQDKRRLEKLLEETNVALAMIERDFPISVQVQAWCTVICTNKLQKVV